MEECTIWENITRNELLECCIVEGLSDPEIAQKYGVTTSKVKYKRRKMRISHAFIAYEWFKRENPKSFEDLNEAAKNRLFGNMDAFSKMITCYAFRNGGHLEDIHAKGTAIHDSDMKQLNKHMVDRIAELLMLADGNEWLKVEFMLKKTTGGYRKWDACNPDLDEIDDYFYSNCMS